MSEPTSTLLQAPPSTGPLPSRAVPDATSARGIVDEIWTAGEDRRYKWTQTKGMFCGNAPYSWSKLRNGGQQWRTNINSLEGKSFKSTANTAYYDLFSSGRSLIEFRTFAGNPAQQAEWSRIVTKELDALVKKFPSFDNHMHRLIDSFVGYGKGFAVFDGDYDWRIRSKTFEEVIFPNGTSTDPDEWDVFVVNVDYPIHTLNKFIMDTGAAAEAGWKVGNVRLAMARASNKNDDANLNPLKAQQMAQDYDYLTSLSSAVVKCAWLYWREYDGSWSHALLPRENEVQKDGWLFVKFNAFEDIRDKIAPFVFEVADGSINGVNGLGKDIFAIMQVKDRLNCSMIDNVFLRTSVVLQARTADARMKAGLALLGGLAVLPQGYDVQPGTIFGDIDGALAAKRDLDLQVSRNTGVYRPMLDQPTGNPRTLGEVNLQYATASQLTTSAINRFYNQLDWMWRTVFNRIMTSETILRTFKGERWAKEVLEFRKRIKDAGVPNEALEKVEFVRSVRALGAGSAAARIQTMNQMMPILPALGGNGRQNFLDDYVAANSTYAQVERYFPRDEIGEQPSHDVWEAVQENAALKTGNATVVTETQDHLIHWQTHASEVAGLIQQVSQGAIPPSAVAQPAVALAQHAAEHAQLVAQDGTRGETAKQIVKAQKELEQQVASLVQAAQAEQKQAQEQQAMMAQAQGIMSGQDPDTQLKAAEAQNKMQLSQAKTQHQMGLRQAQAEQKLQINAAMAAQKLNQQAQAANKPKGNDNDRDN